MVDFVCVFNISATDLLRNKNFFHRSSGLKRKKKKKPFLSLWFIKSGKSFIRERILTNRDDNVKFSSILITVYLPQLIQSYLRKSLCLSFCLNGPLMIKRLDTRS